MLVSPEQLDMPATMADEELSAHVLQAVRVLLRTRPPDPAGHLAAMLEGGPGSLDGAAQPVYGEVAPWQQGHFEYVDQASSAVWVRPSAPTSRSS